MRVAPVGRVAARGGGDARCWALLHLAISPLGVLYPGRPERHYVASSIDSFEPFSWPSASRQLHFGTRRRRFPRRRNSARRTPWRDGHRSRDGEWTMNQQPAVRLDETLRPARAALFGARLWKSLRSRVQRSEGGVEAMA